MASNYAARAATTEEKIKLRDTSEVIFTARINQSTPLTKVTEITYDGETGTYTDIKAGMLVWIGSSAGTHNRGIAHIRTAATSTKILINLIKFTFADNDYITIKSVGRQASILGLAIQHPAVVCTADVQQTFTTLDGIAELIVDNNFGYLDVVIGQTVMIYSSTDVYKGTCRVRKLPTVTRIYINQVDDIQFANDDKIVILDSFSLWQRDTTVTGGVVAMDYDILFNPALIGETLPRIGPLVAVLHLTAGSVTFNPPDPTDSECYEGASIVSYLYDAPGAATTTDMDTSAPEWTYDTVGEYRWSCTITDSLGREFTSYRWIFVDPPNIPFHLEECSGDVSDNGWSFSVTVYDDATKADIVDRALVTLYATDYYSGVKDSIGKIAGYENILCSGWIDGESITTNSDDGSVTFTVQGAAHWLSKIKAFPFELQDSNSDPTDWKQIKEMTIDKALAHLLYWTSTAPLVMDCYLTDDTTRLKVVSQPSGSLFDQINGIALNSIFATPLVNSYGQLYIEVDIQIVDTTTRSSIPVVMDITKADREEELDIERNTTPKTAMVELGALSDYDGANDVEVHSRAPGNSGKTYGSIDSSDNYIIIDQAECNRIAGCLLAIANPEFESLDISLIQNNRLFDICPRMYGTISVAAGDTPRGIELSTARLIPRKVEFIFDEDAGSITTDTTFEIEAIGFDGVTYIPPTVTDKGTEDYGIGGGNLDFPNADLGSLFPDVPVGPEPGACGGGFNSFTASWDKSELRGDGPDYIANCYFPCKVRPKSYNYASPSKVAVGGHPYGDAVGHLHLYGIKAGARVITADSSFEFDPGAPLELDGFQLELDAGLGSDVTYVPLDVIDSGSVAADDAVGDTVTTVASQYYSVEGNGEGWESGIGTAYGVKFSSGSVLQTDYLSLHNRRYYTQAGGTSLNVTVDDAVFVDNSGSSGWFVRDVRADGRRITLGSATIQNICPI